MEAMKQESLEHLKLVLVEALLDLAGFLSLGEDSCDQDLASDELSNLSAILEQLNQQERLELLRYTKEIAHIKEQTGADHEFVNWILAFGRYSGLEYEQ